MDTQASLQSALELIQPWVIDSKSPETNRLDVSVSSANLFAVAAALIKAQWGYLSAITGLDHPATVLPSTPIDPSVTAPSAQPEQEGSLEALYHFCSGAAIFTLRVSIPYKNPVLPSICGTIPSATLYERELMELYGIEIIGTPNTNRLLLSDDWPQGVYPMRKSFTGLQNEREPSPGTSTPPLPAQQA